ncbi:D-alanine--D-alanine ligase [Colwellia sp. TT2012]|uniref:D-alanine--D-alanine ligase n=1 Tax=Colwellia sp. TT2012 TaxID=1720342 RepID=UPI00070AE853|nr:D-alanine--D-alanine ligase [Colwellia sp. TT2012]
MKIEIITTPNQKLKETGFGSINACEGVLSAIRKMGHTVQLTVCKTMADLDNVIDRSPDLVVLAVKYIPIDNDGDIWLSEYFMRHKVNFTGSLRNILEFDSNKVLAKTILQNKGIVTAKYFTTVPGKYRSENELPIKFPLFLKPIDAANGNGIDDSSWVVNFSEFEAKVLSLYTLFSQPILVEEYLDGREFTVAIISKSNGEFIVAPIEIIPPESKNGLRILGHKVKNDNSEALKKIDNNQMLNKVKQLALNSFINLGIRDFARIDIKSNKNGECFFMEANLVPGLTPDSSYFPKSCEIEFGLSYDKVIQLMLDNALYRAQVFPTVSQLITPQIMAEQVSGF